MNKKNLLPILLILISMAGISCISAADTNNTGINDLSPITVEKNINPEVSSNTNNNLINRVPEEVANNTNKPSPENNTPKLKINGPKIPKNGPKINGPKTYKIIKSENFKANGTEMFIALTENAKGQQKVVCLKASSGLNTAGSSVVADTGEDAIRFLEDLGVINKVGYYAAKLHVKAAVWMSGREVSDAFIEYWTYILTFKGAKLSL